MGREVLPIQGGHAVCCNLVVEKALSWAPSNSIFYYSIAAYCNSYIQIGKTHLREEVIQEEKPKTPCPLEKRRKEPLAKSQKRQTNGKPQTQTLQRPEGNNWEPGNQPPKEGDSTRNTPGMQNHSTRHTTQQKVYCNQNKRYIKREDQYSKSVIFKVTR